ncbi:MAG: hypothetical protein ACI4OY_09105 [Aristaeellaceae bacterium]
MKRTLIAFFFALLGMLTCLGLGLLAYLHPAEGWPVVNGPFIGSLEFNRLLLPFILSALLMVLGLGLLAREYFRKE